ncbi:MAG: 1-acyl-sn-glycerol-3-phosphate acyltransferase [Bacteroidales bacterium]|nr:1-acyl-sn-glycerol-3-phosphate acyltransferase [Bacteroidales bacterium]
MSNINIANIIKNSDSKFLKSLPDFAIKIIAIIIRQKSLNKLFSDNSDYVGVDFPPKVLEYFNVKVDITGESNLPINGKCIFVSNHPFGLIDGLIILSIVGKRYGDLRIISNDYLKYVKNLNPITFYVNVFEKNSRRHIAKLKEVYGSDLPITNFPAGLVSRIKNNKIQDGEWKKSFVKKSIENKRDIVPIKVSGRNSILFYAIFLCRQIFKIKMPLELILLPREMYKKRGKTIKVSIGKTIHYQELHKTLSHWEWAQDIRLSVYSLDNN